MVDASDDIMNVYATKIDDRTTVQNLMLTCMDPEMQKRFANGSTFDMIETLKALYQKHARAEYYEITEALWECMMDKGTGESFAMLKTVEARVQKDADHVMMVNKTTSFKKKGKAKRGKGAGETDTQ